MTQKRSNDFLEFLFVLQVQIIHENIIIIFPKMFVLLNHLHLPLLFTTLSSIHNHHEQQIPSSKCT